MKAIEIAQHKIAQAQEAQKEAEGKIAALQGQMDKQYATFVFARSRLEKMGIPIDPCEDDPDGRIKLLESRYQQILMENRRLRELLEESVVEDAGQPAPESTSTPVEQSQPQPLDADASIEIDPSPRIHRHRHLR